MPILSVCTSCKSTYRLGTKSCPRCRKALTHFKARIKLDGRWLSRQSQNLGELRAFLQAQSGGTPGSQRVISSSKMLVREPGELSLRLVWGSFLPWAVEHLRSWKSYETLWRLRLGPALGSLPLSEVTPERLYDLLEGIPGAAESRRKVRALVSRLFTWARRRMGYRGENPVQFVETERADNVRRRVLSPEEAERLLGVLESWPNRQVARLILFLYHTGRRRGECRKLTWDRVDLEQGVVTFDANTTKSKKTNVVPVSEKAWDILREAHQARINGSPLVFPSQTGGYAWDVSRSFGLAAKRAGIPDLRLHDLRRGWISRTLARGVGAFIVKDLAGHEHITTTQRYVNLDLGALERAVRP